MTQLKDFNYDDQLYFIEKFIQKCKSTSEKFNIKDKQPINEYNLLNQLLYKNIN